MVHTCTRHGFLTPGHNCWFFWTSDGNQQLRNEESASHRSLEELAFAIDKMAQDGWHVENIFVDAGAPSLVMMTRQEQG